MVTKLISFLHDCVNKFLNSKCGTESTTKIIEDKVETIFFVPYVGLSSVIFGRKIRDLLIRICGFDTKIVYTTLKVKNYFFVNVAPHYPC